MSCSSFTCFSNLAPELRAEIWHHAIVAYVQDLIDSLPPRFHEYDANTLDYEDLVDCFPILGACREARELAIRYFQRPGTPDGKRPLRYRYIPTRLRRLKEAEDGSGFILISRLPPSSPPDGSSGDVGEEDRQQHSATMALDVSGGLFRSPQQLVDVISRYFDDRGALERMVLNFRTAVFDGMGLDKSAYWPSTSHWLDFGDAGLFPQEGRVSSGQFLRILEKYKPDFDESILDRVRPPPGAYPVMSISKDRSLRLGTEAGDETRGSELWFHLLRVMELVDVSREKLPGLKRIDVNCETIERSPIDQWEAWDWEDADGEVSKRTECMKLECMLEGDELFGWITRCDPY
ncbi:hypothetical protein RB595_008536 [Gaeumannomyces hyphopodioides]